MKVLHIVPSYKPAYIYGGPIESVASLCEELVNAGHDIQVFTTTANGERELNVAPGIQQTVDGVPVIYFRRITKDHTHISPHLWRRLWKEVKQYDVVHIHSWWNLLVIVTAFICFQRKVKVVLSPRGMLSDYILRGKNGFSKGVFHRVLGQRLLRRATFHATSPAEKTECRALIPNWQGFMLPNIIRLPPLRRVENKNPRFTILFLSRIHPKKGIELLLHSIAHVNNSNLLLKIAGDGDPIYIRQLKQLVVALRIGHQVEWLGWKNRTEKFLELQQADLFALLSHNENFANVVIEALHAGTPVLVSDKVGLADYVQQEGLGWVSTLSKEAIAKQLQHIIDSPELLQKIRRQAPGKISASFSPPAITGAYMQCYRAVLSGNVNAIEP